MSADAKAEAPSETPRVSVGTGSKRAALAKRDGTSVFFAKNVGPPDVSVVGRSFEISEAVETDCKIRNDYMCNDVQKKLAELSQEPRDPHWASTMEALIEHDILFDEDPGRFSIRNIECRTTLCAAEVESTASVNGKYGSYLGGKFGHHDDLNAALHTNYNTFARETGSTGARVAVTVITFTRL
jgi:hypothetical protein